MEGKDDYHCLEHTLQTFLPENSNSSSKYRLCQYLTGMKISSPLL